MYQKMYEQAEAFFKPLSQVVTASQTAFETLSKKQSDLVVTLWQESMDVAQKLAQAKDGQYLELQTAYWQGVSDKLSASAQDTFSYLQTANESFTSAIQEAWTTDFSAASAAPEVSAAPSMVEPVAAVKPGKIAAEPSLSPVAPAKNAKPKATSHKVKE